MFIQTITQQLDSKLRNHIAF